MSGSSNGPISSRTRSERQKSESLAVKIEPSGDSTTINVSTEDNRERHHSDDRSSDDSSIEVSDGEKREKKKKKYRKHSRHHRKKYHGRSHRHRRRKHHRRHYRSETETSSDESGNETDRSGNDTEALTSPAGRRAAASELSHDVMRNTDAKAMKAGRSKLAFGVS